MHGETLKNNTTIRYSCIKKKASIAATLCACWQFHVAFAYVYHSLSRGQPSREASFPRVVQIPGSEPPTRKLQTRTFLMQGKQCSTLAQPWFISWVTK